MTPQECIADALTASFEAKHGGSDEIVRSSHRATANLAVQVLLDAGWLITNPDLPRSVAQCPLIGPHLDHWWVSDTTRVQCPGIKPTDANGSVMIVPDQNHARYCALNCTGDDCPTRLGCTCPIGNGSSRKFGESS